MLQKLSDGAKGGISKFILVGFLFMAVLGLVLTDVGGFFRDGVSSTSVAEVGSEDVAYHEFDRYLRGSLARQQMSVQDAYQTGQLYDILDRYTQNIVFTQASQNLGIRTSDEAVAKELHRFVKPFITKDTTAQQALTRMLLQQGITEESFVKEIRRDLTSDILKQAILSGVETAPTLLSQELLRYQNESRDITYINLPHDRIQIDTPPTEDELREFYQTAQNEYGIPERRGFTIAILNPETITADIEPTEEEAREYYEDNLDRYETPSGRKVEQAIFATEEEAQKALEEVLAGTPFKKITGDKYRGDNIYQEENAPDALKDVVFSDDESKVRGPVKSPLGWHIINDLGDAESSVRPFEDVKKTIMLVLTRNIQRDIFIDTIDSINDRIDDGEALAKVAEEYKMETMTIDPIDQFGMTADNQEGLTSFEQDRGDLIDILFGLYENEISQTLELSDGSLALLKVEQIIPESVKPFEEVRDQIEQRLIANKKRADNQLAVQDYYEKLKSGEITLQKISTDTKQNIDVAKNVQRAPDPAKPAQNENISVNLRVRIFSSEPGEYILSPSSNGFMIAKSSEPRMGKFVEPTEEAKSLARQMTIVMTLSTFYNHLSEEIPVKINQRLLDQLYAQPRS